MALKEKFDHFLIKVLAIAVSNVVIMLLLQGLSAVKSGDSNPFQGSAIDYGDDAFITAVVSIVALRSSLVCSDGGSASASASMPASAPAPAPAPSSVAPGPHFASASAPGSARSAAKRT